MKMRDFLPRSMAFTLGASLLTLALSAHATTGTLTQREPVPHPPTDSNGCMIEAISGYPSDHYQLEGRAEREAIDRWKKQVKRVAPPEFASWKHANRFTKSMNCEKFKGRFRCWAKAQPCARP